MTDHIPIPLGGLRYRRRQLELSQAALAKALGWDQSAYSKIERGVYEPSLSQARQLAKYFDCSIEELL